MTSGPVSRPPARAPQPPAWALRALRRLLLPADVRTIRAELEELHALWTERLGPREADRRFLHQWRQYPWRALAARVRGRPGVRAPRRVGGDRGWGPWITPQGVAHSARSLARAPGLTATIVLTVGVGIGGCTTIFSLMDALYLRPLPYPDARRLAWIYTDAPPNRFPFSVVDFQALGAQQTSFEDVAAYRRTSRTLTTPEGAELLTVLDGTPGLLELWGIPPHHGRTPTDREGAPDAPGTVLVTVGFADRYLGVGETDAAAALGRSVTLDGEPYEVVGVLPPSLGPLARGVQVVPTLRLQPPPRKGPFFLRVFGRLRPDVAPAAAAAELRALNRRIFPLWADSYQDETASWGLEGVEELARADAGRLLGVLMGAMGLVLLIAVANAANLLVARVAARSRELAVRVALGASRSRIWTHLLTESGLLAAGGVAVGLVAARAGVAVLPVVASSYLQRADEARLTGPTLAFALALAAACGVLFSLVPALHRGREGRLAAQLRAGGRAATAGGARQRSRRILAAGQIAVVMPLLAGSGLLLSSLARLQDADPGFDADRLLTMRVSLPAAEYPDDAHRRRFWDAALERLAALPGVEGATLSSERPPDDVFDINNFDLEDRPTPPGQAQRVAPWVVMAPSYFEVMGIPLREGRGFQPSDLDDDAPPVLLVDETWARRHYPGESALGRRLYAGGQTTGPRATVIGVVGSVPYTGIGTSDMGAMYQPAANYFSRPFLVLRVSGDPARVTALVREELRRLDPGAPVTQLATGTALLDDSLTRPRHLTVLLSVFSAVALGLAVVGVYGVTAYSVQQRRGDIAVRLALGGAPRSVLGATLWDGVRVSLAGLAVGALAALLLTGTLSGLLYGVTPHDPAALVGAGALLLGVSTAACLLPASRAVRVDPASALREE